MNFLTVDRLGLFPAGKVGILNVLGNDPVGNHQIGGDVVEAEVGMGAQRFFDHHFFGVGD